MFISTRDNTNKVHASEAIMRGMVPEGGLFLPEALPQVTFDDLAAHTEDSYQEIACWILGMLLDDFTPNEVADCVAKAYNEQTFDHEAVTPLVKLTENRYILELWHGPTAAFKDLALQIMPHLLVTSVRKNACEKDIVILVATSGDTGKAALEGFKNVKGTQIIVFYPHEGVSRMQELQMVTTDGNNTSVVAVKGNFDDCQRAVKEIFADQDMIAEVDKLGYQFSSANSINWGRLSPQVVYYFSAYLQLVRHGRIKLGDKIDFSVPTGNFGNILAGWIAKEMGLPVEKFICASNENNVLTDFFNSGTYDSNRPFMRTISPSMDILVSSNLERYLYLKNGRNGEEIKEWMDALKEKGSFAVSDALLQQMAEDIVAIDCDDKTTKKVIHDIYEETHYLLDTHTAVGVYAAQSIGSERIAVVDATANPFKFVEAVQSALHPEETASSEDALELMKDLAKETNTPVHRALAALTQSGVRPHRIIEQNDIRSAVVNILQEKR